MEILYEPVAVRRIVGPTYPLRRRSGDKPLTEALRRRSDCAESKDLLQNAVFKCCECRRKTEKQIHYKEKRK